MASLSFNVQPPQLSTLGAIDGGQPFMIDGQPAEVYQPVNAAQGSPQIRQVRRMSDGVLTTLPASEAVQLVSIESAVIGPAS